MMFKRCNLSRADDADVTISAPVRHPPQPVLGGKWVLSNSLNVNGPMDMIKRLTCRILGRAAWSFERFAQCAFNPEKSNEVCDGEV